MPAALRRSRPPLPRFALAWFPSFEGIERIEALRARHDPMASAIRAHLSLVFPFPTALTRLQVETHLRRVLGRTPALPVTFRRPRLYANEFVFLMAARGAASIVALHDRLYTRSLRQHLRRDLPYEPHITIARHAELTRLERALEEAEDELAGEYAAVLREATLLSVGDGGKIEPLATIALDTA
jgi:2'-5' RNA ligase